MAHDTVLTFFVIVATAAIVVQAFVLLAVYRAMQDIRRDFEGIRVATQQRLDRLSQTATEFLAKSREPVSTITANLAEISRILRERTSHVDTLVADLVEKSRLQIIRVDQMVSDIVQKVETATDAIERGVLGPIHEVSAIIKGLRTGLEFLFSRRRASSVSEATQDEQLFI